MSQPPVPLSHRLWQAHHAVERALDACLEDLGLNTTLVGVLSAVVHGPGQSAADLARALNVRPQSIAPVVARLEGELLIERTAHPVHGRVVQLFPTGLGRKRLALALAATRDVEAALIQDWEPAEAQQLFDRLDVVRQRAAKARTDLLDGQF